MEQISRHQYGQRRRAAGEKPYVRGECALGHHGWCQKAPVVEIYIPSASATVPVVTLCCDCPCHLRQRGQSTVNR